MTARLPTPGSDSGAWGTLLNAYLSVEHNADGTHAFNTIPTATKTANYTAVARDLVLCDTTGGSFTVTLPQAVSAGTRVAVKLMALSGTNIVTVAAGGTDTINGNVTTLPLRLLDEIRTFESNGAGVWYVVAGNTSIATLDARYAIFDATTFGAVSDSFFSDGVATSASTTFTSATANFTSSDIGKTIVILRAGVSSAQDLHTTIASVTNSTTVVLTVAAGRSQSSCRFYISRSGDQTTAIQNAINVAAAAGGGIVHLTGVGYLVTGLVLGNRVGIQGAGMMGTLLHLAAGSNVPVVRNDYTSNNNAVGCFVRDLTVDGNRVNQTDVTTTLSSGYTAGNATLSLTSSASFLPIGGVLIGTNRLFYTSNSANTLSGVTGGIEGTTDATGAGGATVTQFNSHGIYFTTNPYNSQGTFTESFDPHFLIQNVHVKNVRGDGVSLYGQSETRVDNVWVQYADQFGFRPSFDTWLSNSTADTCGRAGFYLRQSEVKLTNCKAFFNGGNSATEGHGFFCEGTASPSEGTKILSACDAQDNKAYGFRLRNTQRVILQGIASSNSTSSAGTYSGLSVEGATAYCVLDVACTERQNTPTQNNALYIESAATKNQIRLTHGATSNTTVGNAIMASSSLVGGNKITINGGGGTLSAAFASSYTPDPYAAETHVIGALTGNITINAATNVNLGARLRFVFTQDATGGRTVTWDASFVTNGWQINGAANGRDTVDFEYDGSNWVRTTSTFQLQQFDVFTAGGTYTKPAGAKMLRVVCIAGGSGGGAGRRGAAGTARVGGGGGGAGSAVDTWLAAGLITSTVSVTVGLGGGGGAGATTDDTNGTAGTAGGTTLFGNYIQANANGAGAGGGLASGGGGGFSYLGGSGGASASASGGAGVNGSDIAFPYLAPGGAAGGGITTGDVVSAGATGRTNIAGFAGASTTAATAGTSGGGNSTAGTVAAISTKAYATSPGAGGGSGGSSITGVGGAGSAGAGYGAGGGGGGASLNGNASGAGGAGAGGIVMVWTFG